MNLRTIGQLSSLSFLLFVCGTGHANTSAAPSSSAAADAAAAATTLSTDVQWDGDAYTVQLKTNKRERHVEIHDARSRRVARTRIPSTALASVRDLRIDAEVRDVRGKTPILDVRISGRSFQNTDTSYQLVFTKDRREIQFIWSSRHIKNSTGERLTLENLDGGRSDDLVIYAKSLRVHYCGRENAPLFPRVWDERAKQFTPISKVPVVPASAQPLTVHNDRPSNHWGAGTELRAVSSDAGHRVLRSYGRAPTRLSDNDPNTIWQAQGPDAGVGSFITAQINPVAGLAGISYTLPRDENIRPQRLLVDTEHASYVVDVPQDTREGYIALPDVDPTECVTLSVLDAAPNAANVGFAELHLYTGLDIVPPETAFETRIFAPYRAAEGRIEQEQIAGLMTIDDPRLAKGAVTLLRTRERDSQVPIVNALMQSEHGRSALYAALKNTELSSASIAALGRALRHRGVEGIDPLFDILAQTEDPAIKKSTLRILSRALSSDDALRLLPYIENSETASRGDLVFGLAKASKHDINALLHALNGSRIADPIILRAVTRIARRERARTVDLDAQSIAQLEKVIDHENGTVARIGYELAGILHVEALRHRLVDAFESDPQSNIRLAAFRGLVNYGAADTDDDTDSSLLLKAMASDDPSMRIEAARHFRDQDMADDAVDIILQALIDERWPEASRPLLTALIRQNRHDIDLEVSGLLNRKDRTLLRTALVAWQSRSTAPAFDVLAPLYDLARATDSHLSNWVRAVGHVQTQDAADALLEHARSGEHSTRVQTEILEALGRQQIDGNISWLTSALEESDAPEIRRAAARGLAWFTRNSEVKTALRAAKAREEDTRVEQAIDAALRAIEMSENAREILLREPRD